MEVVSDIATPAPIHGGSFVPTMGALHEGHLALIRRAADFERPLVVSLFVNPTQFGPNEDFDAYPRQFEADVEASESAGADVIFAPAVEAMYPPEEETPIPALPDVATKPRLEDARRPGHFAGVCQVCARLFDLVRPRHAIFGEKDYQQLLVIMAMVESEGDRWPGLEIVPHETIRDPDGLAMSSRNAYLTAEQRERALGICRALHAARSVDEPAKAEQVMRSTLEAHELEIDYAAVRDAETLLPIRSFRRPARGLIAATVGNVHLIDNMSLEA
jgi:pantoate--beta-alanine ligase